MNVFDQIRETYKLVKEIQKNMPTRQDLDTALTALTTALGGLSTDINTLIAAVQALPPPGSADFTAEIGQVQAAAAAIGSSKTAVDAEIAALNPPPPPPPVPGP